MKGHKESIKAYDERNAVIMGEIRVYVEEDGAKPADTEDESVY
jgi:hypothetical protein